MSVWSKMNSERRRCQHQCFGKGLEMLSIALGNMVNHLQCVSSMWNCFIVLYSITCTDGCFGQRSYTPENDNAFVKSNNAEQRTISCNASIDNNLLCLNGGSCVVDSDEEGDGHGRPTCSCTSSWTGDRCELRFIDEALWTLHHSSSIRASIFAGISSGFLLLCVGGLVVIVYLRYRKKQWLSTDRLFKATAEELYRRPFNGRSSVVESLSRISSLRRTAASEDREPEQTTTDSVELSIHVECIQNADGQQKNGTTDASETNKTSETVHCDFTSK